MLDPPYRPLIPRAGFPFIPYRKAINPDAPFDLEKWSNSDPTGRWGGEWLRGLPAQGRQCRGAACPWAASGAVDVPSALLLVLTNSPGLNERDELTLSHMAACLQSMGMAEGGAQGRPGPPCLPSATPASHLLTTNRHLISLPSIGYCPHRSTFFLT